MRRLLTAAQAAEILAVSPARVYELMRCGLIPHVRIGRQVRIDPAALEAWIAAGGQALPGGWRRAAEDDAA